MQGGDIGWHVISQQQTTVPDATGRFIDGVTVTFQTDNGITGSVFVPFGQYNPAEIIKRVQQRAESMVIVHGLKGIVRPS